MIKTPTYSWVGSEYRRLATGDKARVDFNYGPNPNSIWFVGWWRHWIRIYISLKFSICGHTGDSFLGQVTLSLPIKVQTRCYNLCGEIWVCAWAAVFGRGLKDFSGNQSLQFGNPKLSNYQNILAKRAFGNTNLSVFPGPNFEVNFHPYFKYVLSFCSWKLLLGFSSLQRGYWKMSKVISSAALSRIFPSSLLRFKPWISVIVPVFHLIASISWTLSFAGHGSLAMHILLRNCRSKLLSELVETMDRVQTRSSECLNSINTHNTTHPWIPLDTTHWLSRPTPILHWITAADVIKII